MLTRTIQQIKAGVIFVTIPAHIAQALELAKGDKVRITLEGSKIVLEKLAKGVRNEDS